MQENQDDEPSMNEQGDVSKGEDTAGKAPLQPDTDFARNLEVGDTTDSETESSEEQSLEEHLSKLQLNLPEEQPEVVEMAAQETVTAPLTEHQRFLRDFPQDKLAANLFFSETTGTLTMPGTECVVTVPAGAVPQGKCYCVHGRIHTDLRDYQDFMSCDDEIIVGPVAEYFVECGGTFESPVQVTIPHCVQPDKTGYIRVLAGSGSEYNVLRIDGSDMQYTVEDHCVHIFTRHFTKFIVTSTGRKEDIFNTVLSVAASKKETPNRWMVCVRLMIHMGCTGMSKDFKHTRTMYYDPDMKEIGLRTVTPSEKADRTCYPKVHTDITVDEECDAIIWKGDSPKKTRSTTRGKDVLLQGRQGNNRSETLANFYLDNFQKQPVHCTLNVIFDYGDKSEDHSEEIKVVFPILSPKRVPTWLESSPEQPAAAAAPTEMEIPPVQGVPTHTGPPAGPAPSTTSPHLGASSDTGSGTSHTAVSQPGSRRRYGPKSTQGLPKKKTRKDME